MSSRLALLATISLALLGACDGNKGLDEAAAKAEAEKIWSERCVTCHGTQGAGDGPGAAALVVKPRSFRDPAWQASVDNERIKQTKAGQISLLFAGTFVWLHTSN